jgi:hypothetical protein
MSLPYPEPDGTHTTGHAGSEASHDRAVNEASNGTATRRQRAALHLLSEAKTYGLTWGDLALAYGWHHGQASAVLSVLHKDGTIVRLKQRRNKSSIYVLPEWANDRPTSSHRSVRSARNARNVQLLLAAARANPDGAIPSHRIIEMLTNGTGD